MGQSCLCGVSKQDEDLRDTWGDTGRQVVLRPGQLQPVSNRQPLTVGKGDDRLLREEAN